MLHTGYEKNVGILSKSCINFSGNYLRMGWKRIFSDYLSQIPERK